MAGFPILGSMRPRQTEGRPGRMAIPASMRPHRARPWRTLTIACPTRIMAIPIPSMACSTTLLCHLTIPVTITATCDLAASASNCHRRRVFGVPPVTALTHSNASKRAGVEWERSVHRILLGECPHCGADVIAPQWSEHLSDRCVRNIWSCEACGSQFEETVRFSARERTGAN
jgi:hypothetical protein